MIKTKKFQALNEYVHVEPLKEEKQKGRAIIARASQESHIAKGKVLSIGEDVKAKIKVGDIVAYDPHMIHEVIEEARSKIFIIHANSLYGKYQTDKRI